MSVIDSRVVQMKFDNAQFESGVKESMNTLERLKQTLKMDDLSSNVESIANKFTLFGQIGMQAISRIAGGIVDLGQKLLDFTHVQDLTLGAVSSGWNKYAEKTSSVQTIMSATTSTWEADAAAIGFAGSQMEYVNSQMDKLNWFTDETSYSFTDMTNNIGKFTSQGVALSTATTAMEGISNWAAISGANVQEASRAMYNLSQALGVGAVKLQDWKSIENANMATMEFKQQAIDTAVKMGKLRKTAEGTWQIIGASAKESTLTIQNFNQTLSTGWFSKDVLMDTLDAYGAFTEQLYKVHDATGIEARDLLDLIDVQSKLNKTSEGAVVDLSEYADACEEAGISVEELGGYILTLSQEEYDFGRKAFKAAQEAKTFQEAIDATADAAGTKWMNIFEMIFGDYEKAKRVWSDFADFLYTVFIDPLDSVSEIVEGWSKLGGRELLFGKDDEEEFIGAINMIGPAVAGVIDPIKKNLANLFDIPSTKELGEQIYALTERFRNFMLTLQPTEESMERIGTFASNLLTPLKAAKDAIAGFIGEFKPLIEPIKTLGNSMNQFIATVASYIGKMFDGYEYSEKFGEAVEKLSSRIKGLTEKINNITSSSKLSNLFEGIKNFATGTVSIVKTLLGLINTDTKFTTFFESINDGISKFSQFSSEKIGSVIDILYSLSGIIQSSLIPQITGAYAVAGGGVEGILESLHVILDYVLSLVSNVVLSLTDGKVNLGGFFDTISTIIHSIAQTAVPVFKAVGSAVEFVFTAIQKLIGGFGSLFNSVEKTESEFHPLRSILESISDAFSGATKLLKGESGDFSFFSKILAGLGEAFNWVKDSLSKAWPTIKETFSGLGKYLDTNVFSIKGLISTLIKLKEIKWIKGGILDIFQTKEDPKQALSGALGSIKDMFGEISEILGKFKEGGISGLFGGKKSGDSLADTLKKIAVSIGILAAALILLAGIDPVKLGTAIGAITAMLFEMVGAVALLTKICSADLGVNMKMATSAMIKMAAAILLLAGAVRMLAKLSWIELAKGMSAIVVGLLAMIGALALIKKGELTGGATGFISMAAGLLVLSAAVAIFGHMDITKLVQGMTAAVVAMYAMAGAIKLMTSGEVSSGKLLAAGAALMGVASAMLVLSVAVLAFTSAASKDGYGMGMIGLASSLVAISLALGLLSQYANPVGMIAAAGAMIMMSAALLVMSVGLLALSNADPAGLGAAFLSLIATMASMAIIIVVLGEFGAAAITGALALDLLAASVVIAGAGLELIANAATKLNEVDFSNLGNGLSVFALAIVEFEVSSLLLGPIALALEAFALAVKSYNKKVGNAPETMTQLSVAMSSIGVSATLFNKSAKIAGSNFKSMVTDISDGLKEWDKGKNSISSLATGFTAGLTSLATSAQQAGRGLGENAAKGLETTKAKFSTIGNLSGNSYGVGISATAGTARSAGNNIASAAVQGVSGYQSYFYTIGQNLGIGLANGMNASLGMVRASASQLGTAAAAATSKATAVRSPSRVFMQIGAYLAEGMAIGMENSSGEVENAAAAMAGSAMNTAVAMAASIADLVNSDMDAVPVITPVVDMSRMREGIANVNGLLGGTRSIALGTSISRNVGEIQNAALAPSLVSLDGNSISAIGANTVSGDTHTDVAVRFEGSLAYLASILQPAIAAETTRLGPSRIQ